jgi:hypothetical protein
MTQPIGTVPGYSPRNVKPQLSSTDNKIESFAKTVFEKISTFFVSIKNFCKTKFAALKARITSYFKKSAPTPYEEFQRTAERLSLFSEQPQRNSVESRSTSPADVRQARPGTAERSRSPSPVNNQQAQVSAPVLTPSTGALIPYQPNPFIQAYDAATQKIYISSLNRLVANNYQLPSPAEAILSTLHPFTLLSVNASQPVPPENASHLVSTVEIAPPVNAEQVLDPAIRFARGQTKQPSSFPFAPLVVGAGAAAIVVGAVLKENPEFFNLKAVATATRNGAQIFAGAIQSIAAKTHINNGEVVIDLG